MSNDEIEKPDNAIEAVEIIDSVVGQENKFEGVEDMLFRVVHREPEPGEFGIILLADDVFYFARRPSNVHYRSGQLRIRANTVQDAVTLEKVPGEVKVDE